MEAATTPAPVVVVRHESRAASILRVAAKAPLQIVVAVIGLLWLIPTIGLFITSILPAEAFTTKGWWQIFSKPSEATFQNYRMVFHNHAIMHSLVVTIEIAVGNTVLVVVLGSLAGYAFAWLEFPGRDWLFIGVIGLLVVPLQMALIPMFTLYDTWASSTPCSGSSSSTSHSACRSRSSCCATSSSGSRATSSNRHASTARPRSGSS